MVELDAAAPAVRTSRGFLRRHQAVIALVALALLMRLPLLTISLDEVDTANFVNALTRGYDIPLLRPHPPGYPVYVFMGYALDRLLHDPLRSLALLSALLGSLAVIPLYALLEDVLGATLALVGSLFFIVNPLAWSFSEAALSDVPSLCFVVSAAWLAYRGRTSSGALLSAFVVMSLAIGVRQSNVCFLALLIVPFVHRRGAREEAPWPLAVSGAALFAVTTAAWMVPMVLVGSPGLAAYTEALHKQWTTAVSVYDITHVAAPRALNVLFRLERFTYAYLLTSSWTGDDAKTPVTLLLAIPWLVGCALFIVGFRARNLAHLFAAVWAATIGYTAASIHFLPRYGLPHSPGFLLVCLLGYAFLDSSLRGHPRRDEILLGVAIGCLLILYGIKYQAPVGAFEFTPPAGSLTGGLLITSGLGVLLAVRLVYQRSRAWLPLDANTPLWSDSCGVGPALRVAATLVLIVSAAEGYAVASVAHQRRSPNQQLIDFVQANFDPGRVTACWDNLTHSSFETLSPPVVPTGYASVDDLYRAHNEGRTLLITDRCAWRRQVEAALGLAEVGRFEGNSPLWAKAPSLRLYVASQSPPRGN